MCETFNWRQEFVNKQCQKDFRYKYKHGGKKDGGGSHTGFWLKDVSLTTNSLQTWNIYPNIMNDVLTYLICVSVWEWLPTSFTFERFVWGVKLLYMNSKISFAPTCCGTQFTLEHGFVTCCKNNTKFYPVHMTDL